MIRIEFTGRRACCIYCRYPWMVSKDGKITRHGWSVGFGYKPCAEVFSR